MDKAIEHLVEMIQQMGSEETTRILNLSSAIVNLLQAKEISQRITPYTK